MKAFYISLVLCGVLLLVGFQHDETIRARRRAVAAGGGTGTVTFVQGGYGDSSQSVTPCVPNGSSLNLICTPGSNVTAGNIIVFIGRAQVTGAGATVAITNDTGTCAWANVANPTARSTAGAGSTQHTGAMLYCIVPSTESLQFHAIWSGGGATSYSDIGFSEYHSTSGFAVSPIDQFTSSCSGGNCAAKSTAVTTGTTATITNTKDLVACGIMSWDTAPSWPTISGYTRQTTASGAELATYWQSTTSNAGEVCAFTGASDAWIGVIGAFKTQ